MDSVIFDWGGVLIEDPAPGRTQYCAAVLKVPAHELAAAERRFVPDFQRGLITEEVFWQRVCGELGVALPGARSLWAEGFEAAYAPRAGMFCLAERLGEGGHRVAVLSNTEPPVVKFLDRRRYEVFDAVVLSCRLGVRKPEQRIYEAAIEVLGSPAERTLFVDDAPEFVAAAGRLGLRGVLFESIEQLKSELAGLGLAVD